MRLTFLPKIMIFILLITSFFGVIKKDINLWIFTIPAILLFLLSRKKNISTKETIKSDAVVILSPVFGKIFKVDKKGHAFKVFIKINYWNNWGLYVPFKSELKYLSRIDQGTSFNPLNSEDYKNCLRTEILFESDDKHKHLVSLTFLKPMSGNAPSLWMKSGDKGQGAACFGFLPFGGYVVIEVPGTTDLLVIEGENLRAGYSVLGVIPSKENVNGL